MKTKRRYAMSKLSVRLGSISGTSFMELHDVSGAFVEGIYDLHTYLGAVVGGGGLVFPLSSSSPFNSHPIHTHYEAVVHLP